MEGLAEAGGICISRNAYGKKREFPLIVPVIVHRAEGAKEWPEYEEA